MKKRACFAIAAIISIFTCGLLAAPQTKPISLPADLSPTIGPLFAGIDGAFVIYDLQAGQYARYNAKRCAERLPPFSSFKIVNSLIALETGVAKDADLLIPFDPAKYPEKDEWIKNGFTEWLRDHTLRSAFKNSVVWYFRELARRIGLERMTSFMGKIGYGNGDISDGLDVFWLTGSLKISADEQANFLARLLRGELAFSRRTVDIVKGIMIKETGDGKSLGVKTGGGFLGEKAFGWYVGFVEKDGRAYTFALNMDGKTFDEVRAKRGVLAAEILGRLGIL
ncbi:MAG: penicillin-binding transpeptidase domain-containing protein [Candidatus Aminicenantes bacterium]|nr:penicillin-binding transpeptidase domain-containing protein [Candidatus Aminicenantes bacterium]